MNDLNMAEIRENILTQTTFIVPSKPGRFHHENSDITITHTKNGKHGGGAINIILRNGVWDEISPSGRLICGVYKNRLFLINNKDGYKISDSNLSHNRYVRMRCEKKLIPFSGDYKLKYDVFLEMYYIEKEDKELCQKS